MVPTLKVLCFPRGVVLFFSPEESVFKQPSWIYQ